MRSMRPAIERVMPRAPLQRVVAPLAIAIERGPINPLVGVLVVLGTTMMGCTAYLKGMSGPIAWQATDHRIIERSVSGADRDIYAFALVLEETQGSAITFTNLEYTVSQPGLNPTGSPTTPRYSGSSAPVVNCANHFRSTGTVPSANVRTGSPRPHGTTSFSLGPMLRDNPYGWRSISSCRRARRNFRDGRRRRRWPRRLSALPQSLGATPVLCPSRPWAIMSWYRFCLTGRSMRPCWSILGPPTLF